MRRRVVVVCLALASCLSQTATVAADTTPPSPKPYLDSTAVDLSHLLPPPPPSDSTETKAELGELLTVQVLRTPEMVARAQADAIEEVWRFADVLGPRFTPDALPKTAALFERIHATDTAVLEPAKASFGRPRPAMISDLVRPVVKPSTSGSWPSSHASLGTLMGIVLADMVPEKRLALMERSRVYADNRVIAGAHFPSDVEMGRVAGTAIAAVLDSNPAFKADEAAARTELRAALDLQ